MVHTHAVELINKKKFKNWFLCTIFQLRRMAKIRIDVLLRFWPKKKIYTYVNALVIQGPLKII